MKSLCTLPRIHATAHVLRALLPGNHVRDMDWEDAFKSLNRDLLQHMIDVQGRERLPRFADYDYLVGRVVAEGDEHVDVLKILLDHKNEFFGPDRVTISSLRFKDQSPKTLELMWQHADDYVDGHYHLSWATYRAMSEQGGEGRRYFDMYMRYYGIERSFRQTERTAEFCGKYGTRAHTEEILDWIAAHKEHHLPYAVFKMYAAAIDHTNLDVVQYLVHHDRYSSECSIYREETSIHGSLHPGWCNGQLLSLRALPFTEQRVQVLNEVFRHEPRLKKLERDVLWLIGDRRLFESEEEMEGVIASMTPVRADCVIDKFCRSVGPDHVSKENLRRLVKEHVSDRQKQWIRGLAAEARVQRSYRFWSESLFYLEALIQEE